MSIYFPKKETSATPAPSVVRLVKNYIGNHYLQRFHAFFGFRVEKCDSFDETDKAWGFFFYILTKF